MALPSGPGKSCTLTFTGSPAGRHSLPTFLKFPISSFFLQSTDTRLAGRQGRLDLVVEVDELGITVWVLLALDSLGVALQRVPGLVQQPGHHLLGALMPALDQFPDQVRQRFSGPAQRVHRIAASLRLDQGVQILGQSRVQDLGPLAAASRTPGLPDRQRLRIIQLLAPAPDHVLCHPGGLEDDPRAATTQLTGLVTEPQPPLPLVQVRPDRLVAWSQLRNRRWISWR